MTVDSLGGISQCHMFTDGDLKTGKWFSELPSVLSR